MITSFEEYFISLYNEAMENKTFLENAKKNIRSPLDKIEKKIKEYYEYKKNEAPPVSQEESIEDDQYDFNELLNE